MKILKPGFLAALSAILCWIAPLYSEHIALLIKIPTRGRYVQFFNTLDQYYAKLSSAAPVHFVISCDRDDPVMNSPESIAKLQNYPNLTYYFGENRSKIEACNADIDKHLDFDVLLLGSDDMVPVAYGYDEIILSSMQQFFPALDGVLHFNDGTKGEALNTLPILGKQFYARFGYVYYPEYITWFCDNEFMEVSQKLGKAVYIDSVIIEHRHPSTGKGVRDELFIRNEQPDFINKDAWLFWCRSMCNFEVGS